MCDYPIACESPDDVIISTNRAAHRWSSKFESGIQIPFFCNRVAASSGQIKASRALYKAAAQQQQRHNDDDSNKNIWCMSLSFCLSVHKQAAGCRQGASGWVVGVYLSHTTIHYAVGKPTTHNCVHDVRHLAFGIERRGVMLLLLLLS